MAWFLAPWVIQLLVSVVLMVVAYVIMPKPKQPKPEAAKDFEAPTADAGRPIPVVFGTVTVKGINCLWYGDKRVREYKVKA
jgi:hypothetical protein